MNRLLPRIDRSTADGLVDELMGLDVARIAAAMPAEIMFTFAPVGGVRAAPEFMLRIREHVLDLAQLHGYPTAREQARLRSFDIESARLLHTELSITPHEAGHREVWAGLTAAHLLDVAAWRWGGIKDRNRVNGDVNRDTFRRLWWRTELLQEPGAPWDSFGGLGEDEIVGIMERPIVAGNTAVARSIVARFREHVTSDPGLEPHRMHLMREGMKRLTRLTPFVMLDVLDRVEIDRAVDSAFRDAILALTGRDPLRDPLPEPDRSLMERSPEEAIVPVTPSDLSGREASSEPDLSTAEDEAAKVALAIAARAGKVTNMMLREASGLDHKGARRVLLTLVDRGLLEQRGERRGSHYVVVHHAAERVDGDDLGPAGQVVESLRRAIEEARTRE